MIDHGAKLIIEGLIRAHHNIAVAYESNSRRYTNLIVKTPNVFDAKELCDLKQIADIEAERNRQEISKLEEMLTKLS